MTRAQLDVSFKKLLKKLKNRKTYLKSLPRSHGSNLLSRLLRPLFEKKSLRGIVGANLAAAMVAFSGLDINYHPPFQPEISELSYLTSQEEDLKIVTTEREYALPVANLNYVGQNYRAGHPALDLNTHVSTPVLAFANGRVLEVANTSVGYGHYIVVNHGSGLLSLYAHLSGSSVEPGQLVDTGEQIGQVGMTGWTTGPHLHFEIHDNGRTINPRTYLDL